MRLSARLHVPLISARFESRAFLHVYIEKERISILFPRKNVITREEDQSRVARNLNIDGCALWNSRDSLYLRLRRIVFARVGFFFLSCRKEQQRQSGNVRYSIV